MPLLLLHDEPCLLSPQIWLHSFVQLAMWYRGRFYLCQDRWRCSEFDSQRSPVAVVFAKDASAALLNVVGTELRLAINCLGQEAIYKIKLFTLDFSS